MQFYFAEDLSGNSVTLDKDESHHVMHVMRLNAGSTLTITDGKGMLVNGIISSANPKGCVVEILQRKQEGLPRNYYLHIAIAPTKNIDRFEWFLEKATEIINAKNPKYIFFDEATNALDAHNEKVIMRDCSLSNTLENLRFGSRA